MSNTRKIAIKEFLVNSPEENPKGILLLAHGAAKGMATPFMETIAKGIIESGVRVVRFHFPYMEDMLRSGKQKPHDEREVLRQNFSDVITHCIEREQVPAKNIIIGGKAMGARMASMVADEHNVAGLICLGYPFHPPRKPKQFRIRHLKSIQTPTLVIQGERDPKGRLEEIKHLQLSSSVEFHWLDDGDNDFKPRKNSSRTQEENMNEAIQASNKFIARVLKLRDE